MPFGQNDRVPHAVVGVLFGHGRELPAVVKRDHAAGLVHNLGEWGQIGFSWRFIADLHGLFGLPVRRGRRFRPEHLPASLRKRLRQGFIDNHELTIGMAGFLKTALHHLSGIAQRPQRRRPVGTRDDGVHFLFMPALQPCAPTGPVRWSRNPAGSTIAQGSPAARTAATGSSHPPAAAGGACAQARRHPTAICGRTCLPAGQDPNENPSHSPARITCVGSARGWAVIG